MLEKADIRNLAPTKDYFIGIDSDGCVFDSMELKHKECFCPAFINQYRLQSVCRYARETWEFVNLYSHTRGINRFKAVVEAMHLLGDRPEVRTRVGQRLDVAALETWIAAGGRLSAAGLQEYIQEQDLSPGSRDLLAGSLQWSQDVTAAVRKIVHDLPPITEAETALAMMSRQADCMVVSQTPAADLGREWREHGIDRFVRVIAGQEQGDKSEQLALAAKDKYAPENVLMIGDAPGDCRAARTNGFLFFPIIPGREADSWQLLIDKGLERFFAGAFAGAYQDALLDDFSSNLPTQPPWGQHGTPSWKGRR